MKPFVRHFIAPIARRRRWRRVCEIGASTGKCSDDMLRRIPDLRYTIIDPCFDEDLVAKYANDPRVTVHKANSLDALPKLTDRFDAILIDGDHNWFTVYNELTEIHRHELLAPGGMVFFHDVWWPYARRDGYYQPDTIPEQFRHPYEQKGMVRGKSELVAGGFNSKAWNAKHEGGPRNGVLTAIEDFVAEHRNDYAFHQVKIQFGLGILHRRSGHRSDDVAFQMVGIKAALYSAVGRLRPQAGA
jgi:hypothetical protein